jgi:predicted ATPase
VSDPALAPPAVAAAVGLRELGERPLLDTLADFLRARGLLLILDNAEHLLEFAPFVANLLSACPRLKILATSRQPLRLRGEHEVHVAPLVVPELRADEPFERLAQNESVRLFVSRARDVRPDFELTESNVANVAELCRRLDGLPLAIELAAPRIRLLSPSALLERLESRLGLLTGGARDAPDRQQTLRAAIAWSYGLLSPAEQQFFLRLAVFVGGFTLDAAEAVAADVGSDTLELVSSLLEKSLLQRQASADGESRFRMLELVREFGLEQVAYTGEEADSRQRHYGYFLSLSEGCSDGKYETCRSGLVSARNRALGPGTRQPSRRLEMAAADRRCNWSTPVDRRPSGLLDRPAARPGSLFGARGVAHDRTRHAG